MAVPAFAPMVNLKPMAGWLMMTVWRLQGGGITPVECSVDQLAAAANMHRNSVLTYTDELETAGLLTVIRSKQGKRLANVNKYALTSKAIYQSIKQTAGTSDGLGASPLHGRTLDKKEEEEKEIESPIDVLQEGTDITGEHDPVQEPQHESEAIPAEVAAVFGDQAAGHIRQYGAEKCQRAIRLAQSKAKDDVAGYAHTVLVNGEYQVIPPRRKAAPENTPRQPPQLPPAPPEPDTPEPLPELTPQMAYEMPLFRLLAMGYEQDDIQAAREILPFRASQSQRPAEPVQPIWWQVAYNQLELQFDRASFDTWLRGLMFLRMDDQGRAVIKARNHYAVEMLQYRLYRNVRRVCRDVWPSFNETPGDDLELVFVVRDAAMAA